MFKQLGHYIGPDTEAPSVAMDADMMAVAQRLDMARVPCNREDANGD